MAKKPPSRESKRLKLLLEKEKIPESPEKLLLEKITESPEEFVKHSMKEWVAYSDALNQTSNKGEISPTELERLRRTLGNLLLSFNGFAIEHAIEIGALGPLGRQALVAKVMKHTRAELDRSKGGISKAKKTKARNKKIIELRAEGKTYRNISGILTSDAIASIFAEAKKEGLSDSEVDKRIAEEEDNRISPDAVRKVYERHSEK